MQNYSKVGGILTIVGGAIGVIWLLFSVFIALSLPTLFDTVYYEDLSGLSPESFTKLVTTFYLFWGVLAGICGAVAIISGVYALKGKLWGLALAGAILSVFTFLPLGVAAIIYIALGKKEFGNNTVTTGGTAV